MPVASVTKMHGACNDFIVLDQRVNDVGDLAPFAKAICDRRRGIGADGVIALSRSNAADVRMRIVNADGSEAEMCGNGIRCAVRYMYELGEGDRFRIETLAGVMHAEVLQEQPEFLVRARLGIPEVEPGTAPDHPIIVNVGNPHAVVFVSGVEQFDLAAVAKAMPDYNVHAAKVVSRDRLEVRHFERGVGPTSACGTGAVACAAAAIVRGWCDSPVNVHVPGGVLVVEWDGKNEAFLTGPAERVFDTSIETRHAISA